MKAERISSHQFGDRDLCLEIRPDNWHPSLTGAETIESAYNLLKIETPDVTGQITPAASAHSVQDEITLRHEKCRLYIFQATISKLKSNVLNQGTGEVWFHQFSRSHSICHIANASFEEWNWHNQFLPDALAQEAIRRTLIICRSEKEAVEFNKSITLNELIDKLGIEPKCEHDNFCCLILTNDDEAILYRQLKWTENLIKYRTVLAQEECVSRNGERLETLADKRVAIIGLGSVGSKIAVSLARAGVQRFDLVDADILHGSNLQRHDGDWRSVGVHKVDAVANRIRLVSPSAKVTPRRVFIGAHRCPQQKQATLMVCSEKAI